MLIAKKLSINTTEFPKSSEAKSPTNGLLNASHFDNVGTIDGTGLGNTECEGEGVGATDEGARVWIDGVLLFSPTPNPTARAVINPAMIKQVTNHQCCCFSCFSISSLSFEGIGIPTKTSGDGATCKIPTAVPTPTFIVSTGCSVTAASSSGATCRCGSITKDWDVPLAENSVGLGASEPSASVNDPSPGVEPLEGASDPPASAKDPDSGVSPPAPGVGAVAPPALVGAVAPPASDKEGFAPSFFSRMSPSMSAMPTSMANLSSSSMLR
mmetsp:Transcript_22787/g.52718  ORF Transcript_22787/g.52718 Transcript_22787/m.52718 type:complete len:269 (-) Transcript_22787:695-1501(-)